MRRDKLYDKVVVAILCTSTMTNWWFPTDTLLWVVWFFLGTSHIEIVIEKQKHSLRLVAECERVETYNEFLNDEIVWF